MPPPFRITEADQVWIYAAWSDKDATVRLTVTCHQGDDSVINPSDHLEVVAALRSRLRAAFGCETTPDRDELTAMKVTASFSRSVSSRVDVIDECVNALRNCRVRQIYRPSADGTVPDAVRVKPDEPSVEH